MFFLLRNSIECRAPQTQPVTTQPHSFVSTPYHTYATIIATQFHLSNIIVSSFMASVFCSRNVLSCTLCYFIRITFSSFSSLSLHSFQKQILPGTNHLVEWRVYLLSYESLFLGPWISYYHTNVIHANKSYIHFSFFFLLVFWDRVSCIPGWPPTHYVAEDYLELWIFLPQLPKCWEFTGIHHHTQQDSISKNYKKGTNELKKSKPTTLQKMVTPTFPRQLLEVEIPFYRKLYFSEQSKRRGQHISCQPTRAPLSYQFSWERLDSTPKSDVELGKA